MSNNEYQIKTGNITHNSEITSTVSKVSYEIENAKYHNLDEDKIRGQLEKLIVKRKLPSDLEYINSHTNLSTGTTTTAFLNKDTGKVIVGMTGTNVHKEQLINTGKDQFVQAARIYIGQSPKMFSNASAQDYIDAIGTLQDVGADFNIGLHSITDHDSHFKETQQFIKDLKKDYEIDTITGHSLGGRDAIILGASNDIKNVVVYNPAPISVKDFRPLLIRNILSSKDEEQDLYMDKLLKNYNGNILRIVSENDELDRFTSSKEYVSAGNKLIIKNGKGHSMDGFLGKREQKVITKELTKIKKYQDANNKTYNKVKKETKSKLNKIDEVRLNMMQASGGALSSSQQKLLEYLTAFAIAENLSQLVTEEIQQLEKMYNETEKLFKKNWEDAQESASAFGNQLSNVEVLDALNEGGANESTLVEDPVRDITYKLRQLTNIASQYDIYVLKIKMGINEIVAKDQTLASQIGDLG